VASLSSRKFYNLAKHIFSFSRRSDSEPRHLRSHRCRSAPLTLPVTAATGDQIDRLWLARVELRSSSDVIEFLEWSGFRDSVGTVSGIFVDRRCGLISFEIVGAAAPDRARDILRCVLGRASTLQADGIIIVTNDPTSVIASAAEWHHLTTSLWRKAEAMGISLLNHLVLTDDGWKAIAHTYGAPRGALVETAGAPAGAGSDFPQNGAAFLRRDEPPGKSPPFTFEPRQIRRG
jgi:hypothetical protein